MQTLPWEGLDISVSFHLKCSCRFLIRALRKQRCCLQAIPFEFYLDSTACGERRFEAFTRALWICRQYRSIKLVHTYLIILSLTPEAPVYPGHQRIPLSRSFWGRRGHLPTLPVQYSKFALNFPSLMGCWVLITWVMRSEGGRRQHQSRPSATCQNIHAEFFLVPGSAQACNDESWLFFFFLFCGSSDFSYSESLLLWRGVSRTALLQPGERKGLSLSCRIQRAFSSRRCFSQSPLSIWRC